MSPIRRRASIPISSLGNNRGIVLVATEASILQDGLGSSFRTVAVVLFLFFALFMAQAMFMITVVMPAEEEEESLSHDMSVGEEEVQKQCCSGGVLINCCCRCLSRPPSRREADTKQRWTTVA